MSTVTDPIADLLARMRNGSVTVLMKFRRLALAQPVRLRTDSPWRVRPKADRLGKSKPPEFHEYCYRSVAHASKQVCNWICNSTHEILRMPSSDRAKKLAMESPSQG